MLKITRPPMSNPKPVESSQLIEHPEFTNRLMIRVTELEAEIESLKAKLRDRDEHIKLSYSALGPHASPAIYLFDHIRQFLADREKVVELLREYKGLTHFYCERDDDRCDTCKAVDALLLEGK